MLGDWEMMRTSYSEDPKPQPPTQAEHIEAEERALLGSLCNLSENY